MTKLQMIKRANGSVSYSSNIPIAMIRDLGWEKSDEISLKIEKVRDRDVVVIYRDGDEDGRD